MPADPIAPGSITTDPQRLDSNKTRVRAIRDDATEMLRSDATGYEITAHLAETTESFLLELYHEALASLPRADRERVESEAAMTFVGGSGRGELCPYSDVDILFLYRRAVREPFAEVAARVIRQGWDAGLRIGHAVRTIEETLQISREEPQVASALTELRLVSGNADLLEQTRRLLRDRMIRSRLRAFYNGCLASRAKERGEHGETACILEPDVKRSAGGLRDVHLMRWIGYARFGTTDFDLLQSRGAIDRDDVQRLAEAYEFLLKVRIDLHLAAGRENDLLTREEQQRIAENRDIPATAGVRPVERFMQTYLRHATTIAESASRFITRHHPRTALGVTAETLLTRRVHGAFWLGPNRVAIAPRFRESASASPEQVLDLYRLVAKSGVDPTPETEDLIQRHVPAWPEEVSSEAAETFWSILGYDRHLGRALRAMYRCGVLEWLIPDLRHARCLIQFNQYHSFTVDEHSFRTVEAGSAFVLDDGPLGQARRAVRAPALLNLALFLHDLGKGFDRDHSDVGREIAGRVAARLKLSEADRQVLETLVQRHLLMVHLALRRDITEPSLLMRFCHQIQSPDILRMLFVLSAADLKGVGPGVLTTWKADLLTELYERSDEILTGIGTGSDAQSIAAIKEEAANAFPHAAGQSHRDALRAWAGTQLEAFSRQYLATTPVARIVSDLQSLKALQPGDALTGGHYDPQTRTTEYTVIVSRDIVDGCFHKIAATLSARRLEILSAVIETTLDGTVIDRYRVLDRDHGHPVPPWRITEVAMMLRDALIKRVDLPQLIRNNQPYAAAPDPTPLLSELPLQVATDIHSSDRCTIIDIFAHDRPGLLFTLTRTLYELGLSVDSAKISTHLDQVVDVFYVTTAEGAKITDDGALRRIREKLSQCLQDFESSGHEEFLRTM